MTLRLSIGQLSAGPAGAAGRTIIGMVVPYGVRGNTSAGDFQVREGALSLPDDLSRVKLFRGHDRDRPIGRATSADDTPAGLTMAFRVAATPDGDAAMLEASEGVRDAFSVELDDVTAEQDTITAARLVGVALLPLPAYADARVTEIAAAQAALTPEAGSAAMTAPPDTTPPADTTPPDSTPADSVPFEATATMRGELAPLRAAARPVPVTAERRRASTVLEAARTLAAWNANPQDPAVAAALGDITYTGFSQASTPEWLGELWSGVRYQRQIVPRISSAPLNSYRYTGWQWTTPPAGGTYAGDKANVPSTSPVVGPVALNAERWAGGNDIDRAYFDFNDTEFLDSYAREMADSYAVFTDDDCLATLIADGTAMAAANLTDGLIDGIYQVGLAKLVPTFYLLSPDLIKQYAGMTTATTPPLLIQLLGNLSVDSLLAGSYSTMPANTLIVGARPAAEFRELSGSPLRFDALELARGGVDRAFFGYYKTFVRKPAGIAVVTIGP